MVGDLAQFMVANKLSAQDIRDQAANPQMALNLPTSVIEFLQGQLGQPTGGFPEPFRSQVLEKASLQRLDVRPGAEMPPLDFDNLKRNLTATYGELSKDGFALRQDEDALSAALYPQARAYPSDDLHELNLLIQFISPYKCSLKMFVMIFQCLCYRSSKNTQTFAPSTVT